MIPGVDHLGRTLQPVAPHRAARIGQQDQHAHHGRADVAMRHAAQRLLHFGQLAQFLLFLLGAGALVALANPVHPRRAVQRQEGDFVHRLAQVALAAEQLGAMQAVMDLTTAYVKQRVQFGRVIGSFQAIKHRLADMMVICEAARSAAYYAACVVDEYRADPSSGAAELAEAAALVKVYCSAGFHDVAGNAIQLHGGIGFTWEYDAHLYFKRARATSNLLGSPQHHRERIAGLIGLDVLEEVR